MDAGESTFGFEDFGPKGVVFAVFELFLGWWLHIGVFVDGVVLAALDGIEEDLSGFLNALEEAVVFGAAGGCSLIGVVAEDLLAVSTLDLLLGGFESVL